MRLLTSGPGHLGGWGREACEKLRFVVEPLNIAVLLLSDQGTTDKVSSQGYYLWENSHYGFMWKTVVSKILSEEIRVLTE